MYVLECAGLDTGYVHGRTTPLCAFRVTRAMREPDSNHIMSFSRSATIRSHPDWW